MSGSGHPPSRLFFALLTATCLLLLVFPAAAVDIIPVSTPITITGPGTYELTGDYSGASGNSRCIDIQSSDVIFDGKGYLLDGVNFLEISTFGIWVSNGTTPVTNVTIRNVRLTNWSGGILLMDVSSSAIRGVTTTGTRFAGVILHQGCTGNTISGSTFSDNNYGIALVQNGLNTVSENTVIGNNVGIYLQSANEITVRDNTITGNKCGIEFVSPSDSSPISGNTIVNNNFNNSENAYYEGPIGANFWNTTPIAGTNIVGGPSLGGNFWGTPTGTGFSQTHPDSNNDGFCDALYTIPGIDNIDYYPLYDPAPPVANFTSNVTSGKVPLAVQFNDTSTGSPASWSWEFGDSSPVNATRNATHVYTEPGIYTVTLTATNNDGSNSTSKADYIMVTSLVPPVANFTSNVTSGKVPLSVQFNDTSTGSPASWSWEFGDSSPVNTTRNATHVYDTAGTYTVNLTATNSDGINSTSKAGYITVTRSAPLTPTLTPTVAPAPILTAGFYAFGHVGQAPYPVRFLDQSAGLPTAWKWDFGDGSTSTEQNPTHIFNRTGAFNVALTASNDQASDTAIQYRCVIVNTIPTANFTANATAGRTPFSVQFADESSNANGYQWQFGDSTTSTEQNPVHTYTHPGSYTVTLVISAANYGSVFVQKPGYITVTDTSTVGFSANVTAGLSPLAVQFNESTTGSVQYYYWQFGDGGSSFDRNPVHVYDAAGKYTVSLFAAGSTGTQVKTIEQYINVTIPVTPIVTTPAPVNTTTVPTTLVPTTATMVPTVTTVTPTVAGGTPYNGPHSIPGILQAEDFDLGGDGVAYHDTTRGNTGGVYRLDDNVDIEQLDTDHSPNVGWIRSGEWMAYTVNVSTAGTYDAEFRVASSRAGSLVQVYVDGGATPVVTVNVPNTGDWPVFRTVSVPVTLPAGTHRLVLKFPTDYVNINWIDFSRTRA